MALEKGIKVDTKTLKASVEFSWIKNVVKID
jgi:hypothetical protein